MYWPDYRLWGFLDRRARLEGISDPGHICISDDAHRQIRGKINISYEDMGLQVLKNIACRWLAAALGKLGRAAEAKDALDKAIAVSSTSFEFQVYQRPPWFRPEEHAHMLDGLRKAGWKG